ncbi:hypothetical protein ACHQM5_026583 [Ranunculus cassubicifolius]
MASPPPSLLLVIFTISMIISFSTVDSTSLEHQFGFVSSKCQGSIAECGEAFSEFDMDTEINRRILATTQYISYEALKRNSVPCSKRGSSYYNCKTGSQANPYNRACTAITRCRS